ncbi:MAG: T9SS type A sorting domain-containing protein [Candidatus Cloacimonetes bacterium]|nr:T9SS type A sorting domain-containing protein [Candidatus Cloacimonadota bacterium]MCF7815375.1 T9SS type A sorting domain-containing protein [Candidatus Cloacimonadota bacterium]MCF7869465.1 T9SS type A sorting domain-containing protein [Candidatus Cloacimonadota bacterium]MCF7884832.1 T9SS type A sorting domain-containing protein [Candidatus Cloacimonadota bacterium]
MVYTNSGMNPYDNFERFFHVEMDEFPNTYPQTVQNYNWFHGWNPVTQSWDLEHRFDQVLEYYSPFIDALTSAMQPLYQMNDNLVPTSPANLQVVSESASYIKLTWEIGDCYDMDSYEILYSTEPIGNGNYSILNRTNTANLACLAQSEFYFNNVQPGDEYYFAVRIKDKNNNISDLSNEVMATAGPTLVFDFEAYGRDEKILMEWKANTNTAFSGYNIYRKTETSDFELIDTWLTNPNLLSQIGNSVEYDYRDDNIDNNLTYTYQIRAELNGQEYVYGETESAEARRIFKLFASINSISLSDTCYFGYNKFASNGYDEFFDVPADTSAVGEYFLTEFYEQYWNNVPQNLEQEIYSYYDSNTNLKTWTYRFRTNLLNEEIEIGLASPDRNAERIYLYRGGNYVDLTSNTFSITPTSTGYYTFTLYLGNLQPNLEFTDLPNQLYFPNESVLIDWNVNLQTTIDLVNVYAENDEFLIPIASDQTPNQTEADWQIPNLLFENAKIRIDLIMAEGDTLSYYSPYSFGVISPQTTVQTVEGWNLKTHNFTSDLTLEEVYGMNAELYELQQNFVAVPEPDFCYPYWIFTPQSNYSAINSANLQTTAFSYPLELGWNLVPNPHRTDYKIDQLIFSLNNVDFQFYQAIQNNLIEPVFFGFDSGFEPADILQKDKAYYLFCYQENLELKFIPFYENEFSPELELEQKIKLTAEQNDHYAQIIVGSSAVADSLFDANFDILKPELLPFDDNINFYLPLDWGGQNPVKLHQSVSNWNSSGDDIMFEYPFELELLSTEMVHFHSELTNIPDNIYAYLQMPNELIELDSSANYFPANSLVSGSILISNEPILNADDEIIPEKFTANNFPNPFNPQTNISFNLPSADHVVLNIYNIKGQKVKQLISNKLAAGKHSMVWNGRDDNNKQTASGVYFYRLSASKYKSITRKMLLLK